MAKLTVGGLGPGGIGRITQETWDAIYGAKKVYFRTYVHPGVDDVVEVLDRNSIAHQSFDDLYEEMDDFEDLYASIAKALVAEVGNGGEDGYFVYLVPGSPLFAEATVDLLKGKIPVLEVLPGVSFFDLTVAKLAIDPFAEGLRLVDSIDFVNDESLQFGNVLLSQIWSEEIAIIVADCLSNYQLSFGGLTYLYHLGLEDEIVREVGLSDLPTLAFDHLTSLYISGLTGSTISNFNQLFEVVKRLRRECPWDQKQSHTSLGKHLIEEVYEAIDAIAAYEEELAKGDGGDLESSEVQYFADELALELGDLLVQVLFHGVIGAERGYFDLGYVVGAIRDKLIRRHPHVFDGLEVSGVDEVASNWEDIKRGEKKITSPDDSVPKSLPALLYSAKLIRKASAFGYGPQEIQEYQRRLSQFESLESLDSQDFGELLFLLSEVSKLRGIDLESALKEASANFARRYSESN
ncbi:MAG: SAM-dependent methyltransferase [Actinomycetota bacterium]|nr:SAM-dependent methyltransferase [Actinomycetota bacterium]